MRTYLKEGTMCRLVMFSVHEPYLYKLLRELFTIYTYINNSYIFIHINIIQIYIYINNLSAKLFV